MTLREIARILAGEVVGGDADAGIDRLAKIEDAGPGEITFFANPKYAKHLATTRAAAVLVSRSIDHEEILARRSSPLALIRVDDAYRAFLRLIDLFHPPAEPLAAGIDPMARVAPSASIGEGAAIGPYVVVGERCRIGCKTALYPGVVLYDDVEVGDDSLLAANVVVREQCRIGDRVIIHPGAVVGADGFGFAPTPTGAYEKIPQRGYVVIENDVEIGANCTIDRATIGETRIKQGAKLDNLVMIAHNVVIGEHTVIASQSGISGSTKLGRQCVVGGQTGFAGHLEIAERSMFGAKTGVAKSVTEPGKTWFGIPAREIRQTMRIEGSLRHLPELLAEMRDVQKRLEAMEAIVQHLTSDTK